MLCLSELKLSKKASADAAASRKPPAGPVLVRRSDVCLSTFYRDCAETADADADDCRCQPAERDSRYITSVLVNRYN